MKTLLKYVALILVLLLPCGALAASEGGLFPTESEKRLIRLINEARRSPLEVARSYGKNTDQILKDFPNEAQQLKNGMAPLSVSPALQRSSGAHAQDMLDFGYYAKVSREGKTPFERMEAFGYVGVEGEEILGMLAFQNFVSQEDAVLWLFKNIFLDELLVGRTDRKRILSPDFVTIGVHLGMGQRVFGGQPYNVYMVVCDFGGMSLTQSLDEMLLILINQARTFPLLLAQSMGLKPQSVMDAFPGGSEDLVSGMEPVLMDGRLYRSASEHAWEMLDMDYLSEKGLDGSTPIERMIGAGYPAETAGEIIRASVTENPVVKTEALASNFERLLRREFETQGGEERRILNPRFMAAGVRALSQQPPDGIADLPENVPGMFDRYFVNLLVCDFAGKIEKNEPGGVFGWVYRDKDGDGFYDPGEGVAQARVNICDLKENVLMAQFADKAGGFSLDLPDGDYLVSVSDGLNSSAISRKDQRLSVNGKHMSIPFKLE